MREFDVGAGKLGRPEVRTEVQPAGAVDVDINLIGGWPYIDAQVLDRLVPRYGPVSNLTRHADVCIGYQGRRGHEGIAESRVCSRRRKAPPDRMDVIRHYRRGQRVVFLKEAGQKRVLQVYPIIASHDIVACVVFCKQAVVGESVW